VLRVFTEPKSSIQKIFAKEIVPVCRGVTTDRELLYCGFAGTGTVIQTNKLHGLSPRANYTDRATAACQRSDYQLLRIEGATWSA
jgi:hypothetical protein